MDLYTLCDGRLARVPPSPFALEKELQDLIQEDADVLFGVEFIKNEMTFGDYRIDTLCFDPKTKSFVIIEYKKASSSLVVDQGRAYLSRLPDYKADFTMAYAERKDLILSRDDVNWHRSRLIIVSTDFTKYQMDSTKREDRIELWEVHRYSGDILILRNIHGRNRRESPGNNVSAPRRPEVKPKFGEDTTRSPT